MEIKHTVKSFSINLEKPQDFSLNNLKLEYLLIIKIRGSLFVGDYAIFYKLSKNTIEIITIWDCRQDS